MRESRWDDFSDCYDVEWQPRQKGYTGKANRFPGPIQSSKPSSTYSTSSNWGNKEAEMKRRKRVAMYKAYGVQGKVKASLRNGVRWMKHKYSILVHGYYY
ncbi:unnamed protein product [Rhodiola kirilowii]